MSVLVEAQPLIPERRHLMCDKQAQVLTDIYREDVNLAVWQRELSDEIHADTAAILASDLPLSFSRNLSPAEVGLALEIELQRFQHAGALMADIQQLCEMFCCLFERHTVGVRLAALNRTMCPNFHVDHVPSRLVTTYAGPATEWISHNTGVRAVLAADNGYQAQQPFWQTVEVKHLSVGDVALMKGEKWLGNEMAGLVHRSPVVTTGDKRLFLSLDFTL